MSDESEQSALDALHQELGAAIKPAEQTTADAKRLRARVMERIDESIAAHSGLITVRADDEARWVDMGPNGKKKTLRIDEEVGSELCLMRLNPGSEVGHHSHPVDELCLVLEGDLTIDDMEMTSGDFHFAPKGTSHDRVFTHDGALILLQIPYIAAG